MVFVHFEKIVDNVLLEIICPSQNESFITGLKLLFNQLKDVFQHNKHMCLLVSPLRKQKVVDYHNNLVQLIAASLRPLLCKMAVSHQLEIAPIFSNMHTYYIT